MVIYKLPLNRFELNFQLENKSVCLVVGLAFLMITVLSSQVVLADPGIVKISASDIGGTGRMCVGANSVDVDIVDSKTLIIWANGALAVYYKVDSVDINYDSATFTIKAKYSEGGDKNQCGSAVQITGNCEPKNIASGNPLKFTTDDPKLKGDINKGTVRCLF